jgi:hypothetical protein
LTQEEGVMATRDAIIPASGVHTAASKLQERSVNEAEAGTKTGVIPTLRYRDGKAAIEWLCSTFGLEKNLVVPDKSGAIAHAQLTFGNGMIMLGSARNNSFATTSNPPSRAAP